ncbi:cyclin-dependent kinase 9-like isoform X2 [Cotesia glomerata]|uniref:cyclin-dependent kinase 9-like isoform X1 n=1 Tax=Cotesia glomerata TaxID=32391 RepID=UPI001D01F20A|nr:cyclin-dependent kinase 9-like isoform X1 [Cotesia glomerata]XP_044585290.1 cyclin-dependent kinase 9-like isoform X2 [Cotesia glomerata]
MSSGQEIHKYLKLNKIGQGSLAEVFMAKDRIIKKLFAMKLSIQSNIEESNKLVVIREAKILKTLNHQNIIKLLDYSDSAEQSIVLSRHPSSVLSIIEFCPCSLSQLIVHPEFQFEVTEIKTIVWQLILGLNYIHEKKIFHTDLRPSNILMNSKGVVKLSDFGLATYLNSTPMKQDWTFLSPAMWYAPPEELLGKGNYKVPEDTWRLGCIIPEMWRKKPIMEGWNRIDQLVRIFELCGSMHLASWPEVVNYEFFDRNVLPLNCRRNILPHLGPIINDEEILEMIDEMLVISPHFRRPLRKTLDWLHFISRVDYQPWVLRPMLERYSNCTGVDFPRLDLLDDDH